MATIHTCDHPDHAGDVSPTEAIAYVTVMKREKDKSNTFHHTNRKDCCKEHIGFFADRAYTDNIKDPLLSEIRVGILVNRGNGEES